DWPNPTVKRRDAPATWTQQLDLGTLAGQLAPFASADWPNPAPRLKRDLTWTQSFDLKTLSEVPIVPDDWPLPARRAVRDPGFLSSLLESTLAPLNVPFAATDWPNPVGRARREYTWMQRLDLRPLAENPFAQD